MYYLIGDIHGYFKDLNSLMRKILPLVCDDDKFIFLGDYIDRGPHSFEVIEYLLGLTKRYQSVFLMGNHEQMFLDYLAGEDQTGLYLMNGGTATIRSYRRHMGSFEIPDAHMSFFLNLEKFYEGEDFIAVHAGLMPRTELHEQQDRDMLWVRMPFYRDSDHWDKTIIFGHTPTRLLSGEDRIYHDKERNIIGIDTGVIAGGPVCCLRWPDKEEFYSNGR